MKTRHLIEISPDEESIHHALDELMTHCARLTDHLAAQGFINDETYAALTKIICEMGRCWREDEIESFKIFHSLFLSHYHLILWVTAFPSGEDKRKLSV